jgi:DNA-binding MarR family transcriptional regulator
MLSNSTSDKVELTEVQRVILRMYAKNPGISLREIAKKIIHPNKTMIGVWVQWFEKEELITRIGNSNNKQVFVTEKGKKAMQ